MYTWHNEISQAFLEKGYLLPGQTVQERIKIIGDYAEKILKIQGYSEKFQANMSKGWYSLSTPIWCNFGTDRGMAISCFGSNISDDMSSILYTQAEVGMMSKLGGGTSAYFGHLRGRGEPIKNNGQSSGSAHFARLFENVTDIVSQGSSRRGSFAGYIDIEHKDIDEWLTFRTEGSPIQNMSYGICVSSKWIKEMKDGNAEYRKRWGRLLQLRSEIGYPYLFFTDNANNNTIDVYKDKNLKITHSNLCNEIYLADGEDESFVCDLSSLNVLHYDEWKDDPEAIEILVMLLDAVMTDFIKRASKIKFMERAVNFAKNQRALGIGVLGWHSYLQSKMIAFESMEAKYKNLEIFKHLKEKTYQASAKLAEMYGEPELLKGYGRRNATLIAIAPTTSSAFILGQVSQSIEPWNSNYFIKDLAKGKFTIKNVYLEKLLQEKGLDTPEIWKSILIRGGSVQHLKELTDNERAVFKTFGEISQKEVIIQAAQRQKYIDQGQSLNLMIHPDTSVKDINALVLEAHDLGIKGLYYQHATNAAQEFSRNLLTCTSCE